MADKKEADKKVNELTLMYMSSYGGPATKEEKGRKATQFSNADRRFYKKRILEVVKEILRGGEVPPSIKDSSNHFMGDVVKHLKEIDRRDIIQAAYKDITDLPPILETDDEDSQSVEEANVLMMNQIKTEAEGTLDTFVERTGVSTSELERPAPQKKIVNLSDPQLRTKGVDGSKRKSSRRAC